MNNEMFIKLNDSEKDEFRLNVRNVLEYLKNQYHITPELFLGDWGGGCSYGVEINTIVDNIGISYDELLNKVCSDCDDE